MHSSSVIIIYLMELGHLLTRSGLTYPEVSSKVCLDSFCQLGNSVSSPWVKICPASFRETCQWLKFPPNGLRAQSRVSPVVGLLPSPSGPACLQHVNRMPRNRLPRVMKRYSPTGRRNHGRPLKRLLDT